MSAALVLTLTLGAAVFQETFIEANQHYLDGDYAAAITRYEQLRAERVIAPELYFNLGNAYARAQQPGAAILNYERALRLQPGYAEAAQNISRLLRETERSLPRPGPPAWERGLFFWRGVVAPGTAKWVSIFLWLAFWGVLAVCLWRPFPYARALAALLLLGVVLSAGAAWVHVRDPGLAVTVAERAPARYADREDASVRFELYEGDRVLVEQTRGDWRRVRTDDGERGWVPASAVSKVGPLSPPPPA